MVLCSSFAPSWPAYLDPCGPGGVGHLAIQLAKAKGLYVVITASGVNHEYLLSLGADEVIDYHKVNFQDVVTDMDAVLDSIGGEVQDNSWQVLKPGGALVAIIGVTDKAKYLAAKYHAELIDLFVMPNRAQLNEIAALVDEGKVIVNIEKFFSLAEVPQAFALSELGRVRGKLVIDLV